MAILPMTDKQRFAIHQLSARLCRQLRAALLLCLGLFSGLHAAPQTEQDISLQQTLAQAQQLEIKAMQLLSEHFELEQNLLYPENEKVVFFLNIPQGTSVVLQSVKMKLNGRQVLDHRYRTKELESFLHEGIQPLYMAKLPQGVYRMELELEALVGRLVPYVSHEFVKGNGVKFVEIIAVGQQRRELEVREW